jgi:outer membrane receptor protein involved in Fe transport
MFNNNRLAKSVRLAMAFGAAATIGISAPTLAQEQEADDDKVEKIQVTGSRLLTNPNLAASTPVLSVSGEEANIRGNVRIEDFVNVLPQVFAGQTGEVSNGSTGTANLDLRNLGANRTLVLIDGRRLPFGSSQVSAANADLIPTQLVERVDLQLGGGSAVYGSDAVSGVVNFVIQKDFEGVEFGAQYGGQYNDNDFEFFENVLEAGGQPVPGSEFDGEETQFYVKIGSNSADGRGNVTLFASYEDRKEITQDNRAFSGCALGQNDGAQSFGGLACVGSANFRLFGGDGGFAFQEEDGFITDAFNASPATTFNFGPFNFFQRPSERTQIYATGHYEITDSLEAYANVSFTNNVSNAQIAPTASFGIGAFSINCGNPLIQGNAGRAFTDVFGCSADDIANDTIVDGITASHRNVEGGPRDSRLENSGWRVVTGLRGSIGDTWNWSTFLQTAESRDQSVSTNDFIVANVQQAFLATTDANGNVVCTDPSGGCVPFNLFQRNADGSSAITQDQLDFVQGVGLVNGETSQFVVGGDIQANLEDYGVQLPWASSGIGILAGVERRIDRLESTPDQISQIPGGGFTGVGGATLPVAGSINVTEFFAEAEIPLISDKTFAQELTLRAQYRYSDYDTSGNGTSSSFDTDAYGVSIAWAPVEDVRFRGQFQRAVRAPNVIELFTGQDTGLPNLTSAGTNANGIQLFDPCASDAPIASLAACANTGVTAAQFGTILDVISGQTQSVTGGNPNLQPETADTVTVGVVITPEQVPGLSISVDYFSIEVEDAIQPGIPAQTILDNCLATGNSAFCDLITRAPSGTLAAGTFGTGFQATNINIATFETTGIDFQAGYKLDVGLGSINFNYASTFVDSLDIESFPGADLIECSGNFGPACRLPTPEYSHRLLATWITPWDLSVSATWRFDQSTDNLNEADTLENELHAVNYFDLSANWQATENFAVRGGVLNLLGEQPPVNSSAGPPFGNGNTFPGVFDTSTTFFVSVTATF